MGTYTMETLAPIARMPDESVQFPLLSCDRVCSAAHPKANPNASSESMLGLKVGHWASPPKTAARRCKPLTLEGKAKQVITDVP